MFGSFHPLLRHFLVGLIYSLLSAGAVYTAGFLGENPGIIEPVTQALVVGALLLVDKWAKDRRPARN